MFRPSAAVNWRASPNADATTPVVEAYALIESIAPFRVHLLILGNSSEVALAGDLFYEKLKSLGVETLYDDRDLRPGEKFADSDLIGIPTRVVISEKTLKEGKLEVKKRTESEASFVDETEFLKSL